jgi:hypothetical protein
MHRLERAACCLLLSQPADEGHGFARPPNRLDFCSRVDHFLAKHLGGRTEPPLNMQVGVVLHLSFFRKKMASASWHQYHLDFSAHAATIMSVSYGAQV